MKKKTLLVLLVVGLLLAIAFFVFLLIQSIGYFRAYGVYLNTYQESQTSNNALWYDFSGKRITASEWISLMTMHYLIKPLLFLLGSFFLVLILLYITIDIAKREQLILAKRDKQTLKEQKSKQRLLKEEKKREQKILHLTAKIDKLKKKDDE